MANESTSADKRALMEQAIHEMRLRGPMVGAIVEKDGAVVAVGHRQPGLHAERAARRLGHRPSVCANEYAGSMTQPTH